jgi:hypothetical protein
VCSNVNAGCKNEILKQADSCGIRLATQEMFEPAYWLSDCVNISEFPSWQWHRGSSFLKRFGPANQTSLTVTTLFSTSWFVSTTGSRFVCCTDLMVAVLPGGHLSALLTSFYNHARMTVSVREPVVYFIFY